MNNTALTSPAQGLRVLDFTRVLAGPFCTLNLADLGAEVIKIEHPDGGDDTRRFLPPQRGGVSTYFLHVNRNKKSVTLNLATAEGKRAATALAQESDILVENFRPGVMARLGLDYETLSADHPELIYCSISGYGSTGTLSDRAGLDPVIQAECGLMSLTGESDGEPMRIGVSLVDAMTGLYAANMILAAVVARQHTGRGQRVETCLFDTGANMLVNFASGYLLAGVEPTRVGNGNAVSQPAGVFEAADGPFLVTVVGDRVFKRLCEQVLESPQLAQSPQFVDNTARLKNADALRKELNDRFGRANRDEWLPKLRAAGIPAGEIRGIESALSSDEFKARDLLRNVEHPSLGSLPTLRSPMHFDDTPTAPPVAAPELGQHTQSVLTEIAGYDEESIAQLKAAGAIPE
ncbi:MAG: CoA transferase [Gammaproteobacteria bacterium]|nr:CoA transferase [Gammaproteobacteria bacterium]